MLKNRPPNRVEKQRRQVDLLWLIITLFVWSAFATGLYLLFTA